MGHRTGQFGGGSQKISCVEIPTSHDGAVRPKTALRQWALETLIEKKV